MNEDGFNCVAHAGTGHFRVLCHGDGLLHVTVAVDIDVAIARARFDNGDLGACNHVLDKALTAAGDEHVKCAAHFHHNGCALSLCHFDERNESCGVSASLERLMSAGNDGFI